MRFYIFYLLLCVCALSSCIKDIELAVYEPEVAVYCVLNESSHQVLELKRIAFNEKDSPIIINQAKVLLYESDSEREENLIDYFQYETDGLWHLDYQTIPGKQYALIICLPDGDTLKAVTTMPTDEGGGGWPRVGDDHNLGSADYYNMGPRYQVYETNIETIAWIYAMNWNEQKGDWEIATTITCDNDQKVDGFNLTGSFFYSADEHIIHYCERLIGKPLHDRYLRIPEIGKAASYRDCIAIAGDFKGQYPASYYYGDMYRNGPRRGKGYIAFMFVSQEYDQYLKDVIIWQAKDNSYDYLKVLNNNNVYSNILNGTGVFGASVTQYCPWDIHNDTII